MIVRNIDVGWNIVFHAAHGLLAARIAESLAVDDDFPFWFATKQAISTHDDQKVGFNWNSRNYVTEAGAPKDFTLMAMDDVTRVKEASACIRRAATKDRWMGLLVSLHNDVLYGDEDTCQDMRSMLTEQALWREKTLAELKTTRDHLQLAYDWLQWCDRCSLLLCGSDVPAMQRRIEIVSHSNGQTFYIWRDSNDCLRLEPWPFRTDLLVVCWEQRTLRQLSFRDDTALQTALDNAEISICTATFRK